MQNATAMEDWQFLAKPNIPYNPAITLLGIYPPKFENYPPKFKNFINLKFYIRTNGHAHVCNNLILICQNLKMTKMTFSRWMGKLVMVHPDSSVSMSNKKRGANRPWIYTRDTQTCVTKRKGPVWKGYLMHNSNWLTFHERQSYADSTKASRCYKLGRRRKDG